jgi:DNA-binding LytR/AlgR family response regulator
MKNNKYNIHKLGEEKSKEFESELLNGIWGTCKICPLPDAIHEECKKRYLKEVAKTLSASIRLSSIDLQHINYIECMKSCISIHWNTAGNKGEKPNPEIATLTLKETLSALRGKGFIQISRYKIVNIMVSRYDKESLLIIFDNGEELEVSERYAKEVENAFEATSLNR